MESINTENNTALRVVHKHTIKESESFAIAAYKIVKSGVIDPNTGKEIHSIVAMGEDLPTCEQNEYELYGEFTLNPKYPNSSFRVQCYSAIMPSRQEEIKKWLTSGAVKGCGKTTAEKIVKKFGDETIEVLRSPNAVDLLSNVRMKTRKLGRKKAAAIKENFDKIDEDATKIQLVLDFGLSGKLATRAKKRLGEERLIERLTENPYLLCDVYGISFGKVDEIAAKFGIDSCCEKRLIQGIRLVLRRAAKNGDTYMLAPDLMDKARRLLFKNGATAAENNCVKNALCKGCSYGLFTKHKVDGTWHVALETLSSMENGVAYSIVQYRRCGGYITDAREIESIKCTALSVFEEFALEPSDSQIEAVVLGITNPISIITGGPGTGKTTIIKALMETYKRVYGRDNIKLAAPTGRASRRMTEACGYPAETLHRLLKLRPAGDDDDDDESDSDYVPEPWDVVADMLIVDEFSMVDTSLAYSLFKALEPTTKLVIVGDVDQLPSVGAGMVLRDLLGSGAVPFIKLESVFRQSEKSLIHRNAQKILNGDTRLDYDGKTFAFATQNNEASTAERILSAYGYYLKQYHNDTDAVQVITPRRDQELSSAKLLNPRLKAVARKAQGLPVTSTENSETKAGAKAPAEVFEAGDKVMHIRRNAENVSNGDIGYVDNVAVENKEQTIAVDYGNAELEEYTGDDKRNLTHAYAMTVHKSQGSEYDVVIMPVTNTAGPLLNRNLIYTAITRAKKAVVLVGDKRALARAINTQSEFKRKTELVDAIRRMGTLRFENQRKRA